MRFEGKVTVKMNPTLQVLRDKGLLEGGDVQRQFTADVLRRIQRYMPYRTGQTYKLTVARTSLSKPQIVTDTPYAKYLFYGHVMVGRAPKKATDTPLSYTKTKNPLAGPHWDKTLMAAEGAAMAADLQAYINRKAGGR